MGAVSLLKTDIKEIGFLILQEKRERICGKHFPYIIRCKFKKNEFEPN